MLLLLPHLCPGVVPRFVDDYVDLLGSSLRHLNLRYRAAAYLGGGAAEEGPLELDGLAMGAAAESHTIVAAMIFCCDVVVPAWVIFYEFPEGGVLER